VFAHANTGLSWSDRPLAAVLLGLHGVVFTLWILLFVSLVGLFSDSVSEINS
jgi:hypothetical protein